MRRSKEVKRIPRFHSNGIRSEPWGAGSDIFPCPILIRILQRGLGVRQCACRPDLEIRASLGGAAVKRRRNFRRTELGVPALATGSRAGRMRADPSRPVAILVGFASRGARKPEGCVGANES